MKKIFFLAATLVAAMAMNAASFTGFDGRNGDLGSQIQDGNIIKDQVNFNMVEEPAGSLKFLLKNVTGGEPTTFTIGGLSFYASDAQAGKDLWKTYGTYIQPNGARRTITIPTVPGEKVLIYVQDACSNLKVEGAKEGAAINLVASGTEKSIANTLTADGLSIVIYSNDAADTAVKPKYQAILPDGGTGFDRVAADKAAVERVMMNGRVYLRKADGKLINMLGF